MLYDMSKFPEGTVITQPLVIESDLYQDGGALEILDNYGYVSSQTYLEEVSPFIYYGNDFAKIVYLNRGIVPKNYTQIGNDLFVFSNKGNKQTYGGVLDLDFTNCQSISYLFAENTKNVFDKIIIRNLTAGAAGEWLYQYDTKELLFENCVFHTLRYFFDNSNSVIEKISPIVVSPDTHNFSGSFTYSLKNLTDFGGIINLQMSLTSNGINNMPNLNYQSCINVLNGLWDFVGNGQTPSSLQGKLKVHQNFLDLVGDEISIGTNKGWTITS